MTPPPFSMSALGWSHQATPRFDLAFYRVVELVKDDVGEQVRQRDTVPWSVVCNLDTELPTKRASRLVGGVRELQVDVFDTYAAGLKESEWQAGYSCATAGLDWALNRLGVRDLAYPQFVDVLGYAQEIEDRLTRYAANLQKLVDSHSAELRPTQIWMMRKALQNWDLAHETMVRAQFSAGGISLTPEEERIVSGRGVLHSFETDD
jgi:hypothetical protein